MHHKHYRRMLSDSVKELATIGASALSKSEIETLYKANPLENEDAAPLMNRIEDKFLVERGHIDKLTAVLRENLKEGDCDTSVRYNINRTIYLDNKDMDTYRDSMEGVRPRFKVRIRQYAPNGKDWEKVAYIELKAKAADGETKKVRVRIPTKLIEHISAGKIIDNSKELEELNHDLSKEMLWKRIAALNSVIYKYGFKKQLVVTYQRRAYSNKFIRVTVDDALRYYEAAPIHEDAESAIKNSSAWHKSLKTYNKVKEKDLLIVELKHEENLPEWLEELMEEVKAKPVKFSKYCAAVTTFLQNNKKREAPLMRVSRVDADMIMSMIKTEPLAKMPKVFTGTPKKPLKHVIRMQDPHGLGPYGFSDVESLSQHGEGERAESTPSPGEDPGFTPSDIQALYHGAHPFAFESMKQLKSWFTPDEIDQLAAEGFKPTKVPAKTIWSSGRQAFFEKYIKPKRTKKKSLSKGENLEKALSLEELQNLGYKFNVLKPSKQREAYAVTVHHKGKRVGHLLYSRHPHSGYAEGKEHEKGFHEVYRAEVAPEHQNKGLYQRMLNVAAEHVKGLGSEGIMSEGFQRSPSATHAWDKTASFAVNPKDTGRRLPYGANYFLKKSEKIPGGLSSGKKPQDFDQEQLQAGIQVEMEHTSDRSIAQEIAMDHLTEDPDYYKKLKRIEKPKSLAKVDSQYIKNAKSRITLLWPVKIRGKGHILGTDLPMHITLKQFSHEDDIDPNKIKSLVDGMNWHKPDASKMVITPDRFISKDGKSTYHVLKLEGGMPKSASKLYNDTRGIGITYPQFTPHVTVDESLWKEIKNLGLQPHHIQMEIGNLQLKNGDEILHEWHHSKSS